MKVIKQITPNKKSTYEINKMFKKGELIIDNTFQRRYVWEEKHQIALIETILLGYDIPDIYLWQQVADANTGEMIYSVVDGQQRIGAIVNFIDGKFSLKKKYLSSYNKDQSWVDKNFDLLDKDDKISFWEYKIGVKELSSSINKEEIVTLFLRLNTTNKVLNPQELRNAQYNGKFIALALELASSPFWEKYKVFSINEIRRMNDVEFISNILVFLRMGIKKKLGQATINQVYDLYNIEYKEEINDRTEFENILKNLDQFLSGLTNIDKSFVTKTTHLYTLFVIYYALKIENYFGREIVEVNKIIESFFELYIEGDENRLIQKYRDASQDAVKSQGSRVARYDSLIEFIKQNI